MSLVSIRGALILASGVLILSLSIIPQFAAMVEKNVDDMQYALMPSAPRAFAIAQKHFDAQDPIRYDFARAEKYFRLAFDLNPALPHLNHEMARVHFLKGDFENAMRFINAQIALERDDLPNSYYVRGLIEGYQKDYDAAIADYAHYLSLDPHNWAAINDYAWVLLKTGRAIEAARITGAALNEAPKNAWLLNTNAIALYEMGDTLQARAKAAAAIAAAEHVQVKDWLRAYPGNDPKIAEEGVRSLRESASANMHTIEQAMPTSTIQ